MEMDNWVCPKIKAEIFPNCHFDQENADELQDLRMPFGHTQLELGEPSTLQMVGEWCGPLPNRGNNPQSGGPGDELATLPPQRCAEGLP